jgi:O-antigen/teichoic acid export membrane protein
MRQLFKSSSIISISVFLAGFISYCFQLILSKLITTNDYGAYNVLMSFSGLLGIPITILSISVLKQYSIYKEQNLIIQIHKLFTITIKLSVYIAIFIAIIFIIFNNFFSNFMRISDNSTYYNFILMHIVGIFFPFLSFFLQGMRDYVYFSIMNVLNSIIRLIIPLCLMIFVVLDINNVLFSSTLASIIATLILIYFIKKKYNLSISIFNLKLTLKEIKENYSQLSIKNYLRSLLVIISFSLILQIDILIVNYYFDSKVSGNYALASVISKIIFFISSGINTLILNEASGKNFFKIKTKSYLYFSLVFTIFFSTLFCLGSYFLGPLIIEFIYGEKFFLARDIIKFLPFAFVPYALIQCYEYYLLSQDRVIFSVLFIFLFPLLIFFLNLFAKDIWSIIIILGIFGYIYLILGIFVSMISNFLFRN